MMHLVKADPSKSDLIERLQGLSYQINDAAGELHDYQDQLEFNPDRLNYLEERMELINRLKRKYGEDITAVLARRDVSLDELD
jgi:DNA repair protein RecN (Recombination protein N)